MSGTRRYAMSRDLEAAKEQSRNWELYSAARYLGKWVHHGFLSEEEVVRRLSEASNHNGLSKDEGGPRGVIATIKSRSTCVPQTRRNRVKLTLARLHRPGCRISSLSYVINSSTSRTNSWSFCGRVPQPRQ